MSRVAVVTGAAGAIGAAVVARLADDGDDAVGLDVAPLPDGLVCDVSDEGAVAEAFAAIRADHGPPTVLVNCAGIVGAGGVVDTEPDEWRRILDVNLTSAFLCCREVIGDMQHAGGGRIVNVASVTGRLGGSALSGPAYAASKGGLLTLTRFLASEHAVDRIGVNAVAPGPHDTAMWGSLDAEHRAAILDSVPSPEAPGDPSDLAAVVAFLCSPEARYITGATLDVNGGQWMG